MSLRTVKMTLGFLAYFLVFTNILVSISGSTVNSNNLKLETLQLVFRHGARTATSKEAVLLGYNDSMFAHWNGYGQLVDVGMEQMYRFGQFVRKRYGKFRENYNSEEIYARSSDFNRTIQSLQFVLAGLFLNEENPNVRSLLSDPQLRNFSLHVVPQNEDVLLRSQHSKIFNQEVEKVINSTKYQDKLKKYSPTLEIVKHNAFCPFQILLGALARSILRAFKSDEILNIPLPDWCNEKVYQDIKHISIHSLKAASATSKLRRMDGGPLLKEILSNINSENRKKMYLYSGHDGNVAGLARALGVRSFKFPEFGSGIILETWQDVNNKEKQFLMIKGWLGSGNDTFSLKLRNCEDLCPKEIYEEILYPMIPKDGELLELKVSLAEGAQGIVSF